MVPLQPDFANPFYAALMTEQARFAVGPGLALRYPADVLPFAALREPSEAAMHALRELLEAGEMVYVLGDRLPQATGLELGASLSVWQMHFPDMAEIEESQTSVREMFAADAPRMVGLTDIAFPGFFRTKTYLLGQYLGIEQQGKLVAMVGERVALPGIREISALCTHPEFVGRGYAALLLRHMLRVHRAAGLSSFLHVTHSNQRAIALYQRLGFVKRGEVTVNAVTRV